MKKFVCPVCGYVHEGETAPEKCPLCGVPGEKFTVMKEGEKLAAEHEYGVYGKTVKNNPDISEEDKYQLSHRLACACFWGGWEVSFLRNGEGLPGGKCNKERDTFQCIKRSVS